MCNNGSYQLNSQWNLIGVQCNVQCPFANPSISTRPKSNNNSSKSNRTPPKFSDFALSFFFVAKPLTNSSKRPRLTILKRGFKVLINLKRLTISQMITRLEHVAFSQSTLQMMAEKWQLSTRTVPVLAKLT